MEIGMQENSTAEEINELTLHWTYHMISSIAELTITKLEKFKVFVKYVNRAEVMEKEAYLLALSGTILLLALVFICACIRKSSKTKTKLIQLPVDVSKLNEQPYKWSVFDLAKTAYEPGHSEAVMRLVEKLHYDVNSDIPSNGLTLFLCACLSGKRELIKFMISKGADVHKTTRAGDTALYLATFGILSSPTPDIRVLEDLILSGCDVNKPNRNGYIALHRAAGHGNLKVIQMLLDYGADPYQVSQNGIYPLDSAINAGNMEAAALLKIKVTNPYVWDVVEPHTPTSIKLGLQSPQRKHLIESSRRIISPKILS